MTRRGSILLEILLAIVLFAGAAAFTIAALRQALASTERSAIKLRAADLARSALSVIEARIDESDSEESAERVAPADPDGLRVETRMTPSSFPGLSLCEVTVRGPDDAGDERVVFTLRQLVVTPTTNAPARTAERAP